jgi:hypothetical protein
MVNYEYVEYDGISDAHLVLFNVLGYFPGLEPVFDEQDCIMYFSYSQRRFMNSITAHAFRRAAEQPSNTGRIWCSNLRKLRSSFE